MTLVFDSQQSYSEFIGDVTNKNVLKGTDPALYFRMCP